MCMSTTTCESVSEKYFLRLKKKRYVKVIPGSNYSKRQLTAPIHACVLQSPTLFSHSRA